MSAEGADEDENADDCADELAVEMSPSLRQRGGTGKRGKSFFLQATDTDRREEANEVLEQIQDDGLDEDASPIVFRDRGGTGARGVSFFQHTPSELKRDADEVTGESCSIEDIPMRQRGGTGQRGVSFFAGDPSAACRAAETACAVTEEHIPQRQRGGTAMRGQSFFQEDPEKHAAQLLGTVASMQVPPRMAALGKGVVLQRPMLRDLLEGLGTLSAENTEKLLDAAFERDCELEWASFVTWLFA